MTSMQFDTRRIVAAAGESVVKVYDKTDGRHWDCGTGVPSGQDTPLSGAELSPGVSHDPFLVTPSSSASGASHHNHRHHRNSSSSSTSHATTPSITGAVDDRSQGSSRHAASGPASAARATVQQVRIKDGYLVEGRKDGMVGMWAC